MPTSPLSETATWLAKLRPSSACAGAVVWKQPPPAGHVPLFVPSWGLAHSYNQPPAALRLEGKGVQAISKRWLLAVLEQTNH